MDIKRSNPILTAKIVGSYVRQHKASPEHASDDLSKLQQPAWIEPR
jgi:hypothetical protein